MPIAEALVLKGTGIGTVLTFMMGVTALSIPSIVMLKQVMKSKLLGIEATIEKVEDMTKIMEYGVMRILAFGFIITCFYVIIVSRNYNFVIY